MDWKNNKKKYSGTLGKTRDEYINDEVNGLRMMYEAMDQDDKFNEKEAREDIGKYYDEQKAIEDEKKNKNKRIIDGFMSGKLFKKNSK